MRSTRPPTPAPRYRSRRQPQRQSVPSPSQPPCRGEAYPIGVRVLAGDCRRLDGLDAAGGDRLAFIDRREFVDRWRRDRRGDMELSACIEWLFGDEPEFVDRISRCAEAGVGFVEFWWWR